jgi:hypothetical protein
LLATRTSRQLNILRSCLSMNAHGEPIETPILGFIEGAQ